MHFLIYFLIVVLLSLGSFTGVCLAKNLSMEEMTTSVVNGVYLETGKISDIKNRSYYGNKVMMKPRNVAKVEFVLKQGYEKFEGRIIPVNQSDKRNRIYVDVFIDGQNKERITDLFTSNGRYHKFKYDVTNASTMTIIAYLPNGAKPSKYYPPEIAFYEAKFEEHLHGDWKWVTVQKQSCVTDEIQQHICGKCKKSFETRTVNKALGHIVDPNWVVEKQPTCTSEGRTVQKCSTCGIVINRKAIPKKQHSYKGDWIVEKKATCLETGVKKISCENCNNIVKLDIPLANHKVETWHVISGDKLNNPIISEGVCVVCKNLQQRVDNSYKFLEIFIKYLLPAVIFIMLLVLWLKGYSINTAKFKKSKDSDEDIEKKIMDK